MRTFIPVVVLAVVIALSYHEVKSQGTTSYSGFDLVDKTGNIRKPDGYRDHYQILGTFTVFSAIPMASGSPSEQGGRATTPTLHLARPSITARVESSRTEPCW
jgi:hypothetical protein